MTINEIVESGEIKAFEVTADNGQKFRINRTDPYGMFVVTLEKGRTPDKLNGMYTTSSAAIGDIKNYVNNKGE